MRKGLLATLLLLVLVAPLLARNTFWGNRGTFRLYSALSEDPGMLTFNFFHAAAGYDVDSSVFYGPLTASIGFTPIEYVEFSFFGATDATFDLNNYAYRLTGIQYGPDIKGSYPIALDPDRTKELGLGAEGFANLIIPYAVGGAAAPNRPPCFGGRALVTYRSRGFAAHFNAGYMTQYDVIAGQNRPKAIIGVGVDWSALGWLTLLCDFYDTPNTDLLGATDFMRLTPGIRISTSRHAGLTLDLGSDIGLTSTPSVVNPQWTVIAGLSLAFDLMPKPRMPFALLSGRITDVASGAPLPATLTFLGTELAPAHTDPATGLYEVKLPAGIYRVHAEAENYKWKEKGAALKDGDEKILDFDLSVKKPAIAQLTGKVTDFATGNPVTAQISLPGTTFAGAPATDGSFTLNLPPGTYSVQASAANYASQTKSVTLTEAQPQDVTFVLTAKVMRLDRVYFAPGSAALMPSSYPALNAAAEMLKGSPGLRIEIQGHTDSVGSYGTNLRLSQLRAEAVRNYLVSVGVSPERLIARGYGESMPIGDNRTRRGRDLNRRIEFLILGEK